MLEPRFKTREEYERWKAGQGTRSVMRVIGWAWVVLAGLSFGTLLFLKPVHPSVSSRNTVVDNVVNFVLAFLILGGPGLLLVKLARDLRAHNQLGRWVALLLLPISF